MIATPAGPPQRNHFARAKVQLMLNHPFFATLIAHLPTVPRPPAWFLALGAPPTACVDGKRIYYNAEWVGTLSEKQRMGLLAHEVLHPAFQHLWRRGNRNVNLWRVATDLVVNAILLDTKDENGQPAFDLPPDRLFDARFRGMAAEQVYALLEREAQQQPQGGGQGAPPPKGKVLDAQLEQPLHEEGDGDGGQKKDGDKEGKAPKKKKQKAEKDGKGEKPDGDAKSEGEGKDEAKKAPGDGEQGEGDDKGGAGKAPGGGGGGEPKGDEADGDGNREADNADDGEDEGESGEGDEDGDEEAEGEEDGDSADGDGEPAGCGHAHHDDGPMADDADMEQEWKNLINQAAHNARARGRLPGNLVQLVEDLTQPVTPWQSVVDKYATDYKRDDYDMLRQDRRFTDFYFPDLSCPATNVIGIIDSSGSISDDELHAFASEFVGIMRCRGISTVRLIVCDARVTLDVTLTPYDEIPKEFPGRGGTDFRPPFRRIQEQPGATRPGFIVYITDMEGPFPEEDPGIPTIWLASVPEYKSASHLPNPPFGLVVPYQPLLKSDHAA